MCGGSDSTTPMPNNNGNLKIQQVFIPQTDAADYQQHYDVLTQYYEYDALNRLQFANEAGWKQQYAYDRWGNRTISGATGTGINNAQSWIDAGNNRLYAPGDQNVSDPEQRLIRYDPAGNQKADYYSANWNGTRAYDAENRMKSATDTSNNTSSYTYDGDGHRIKRIANGTETWQVYGVGSELIAEYAANALPSSPQKEYGYRNGELLITADAPTAGTTTNFALASNGATASASSAYTGFAASGAINGDRKGLGVFQDGYWSTAQAGFPAWLQVDFNGSKSLSDRTTTAIPVSRPKR